ncbi:MAG: glycosyltransferase [Edaphobacter sp.]|uniref:glycosyltransferase n=1 Tax=Edaphobacter sp. TaxID=1934404 RepID=UPI00239E103F|nr:glycosyltransferase [Edaphobacter sp.]MDE1178856.1 glycosyltransferase [Edaphobacter sp.]
MRVAIVHPWFLAFGGAEQTVSALADIFPTADIFTLYCDKKTLPANLRDRKFITSSLNRIPWRYTLYRHLLPIYPYFFESLDLRGYDLIVSSDSCLAKGIITDQDATHICYCHSPMRCLYDQYREYLEDLPPVVRSIFGFTSHYLRMWDFIAAQRVDLLIANSKNVAHRISTYYHAPSEVIYPPVQAQKGYIHPEPGDYFLTVGRLTTPKRVDLLIEACNRLKKRLIIVGSGRERRKLQSLAGETVHFEGYVTDEQLAELYARCRAFLFAADEDFGIVPVEAQSYGRPVIGYGHGGLLETVIEGTTGVFFKEQTVESVMEAILHFETIEGTFHPNMIQRHAKEFDESLFKMRLREKSLSAMKKKASAPLVVWKRTRLAEETIEKKENVV